MLVATMTEQPRSLAARQLGGRTPSPLSNRAPGAGTGGGGWARGAPALYRYPQDTSGLSSQFLIAIALIVAGAAEQYLNKGAK